MHFLVIGNPENRRVRLFREALSSLRLPMAGIEVLSYEELLQDTNLLYGKLQEDTILRLESPGENFNVRKGLIALGDYPGESFSSISAESVLLLHEERGRIAYGRQWYNGFHKLLSELQQKLHSFPRTKLMNNIPDILTMFDKVKCHQYFHSSGVSVPRAFYDIHDFESLMTSLNNSAIRKVFIKPAHGSSASGVMAFRFSKSRMEMITSIELVKQQGQTKLFNSLKIRSYSDPAEIEELVNTIAREKVIVEEWIPKASIGNKVVDLRVLVIDGKSRHAVVRTSNYPLTNLHLGNKRADIKDLEKLIGSEKTEAIRARAEQAAACFPDSLYVGVDILISNDLSAIKVLEANAFGDLLPGIVHNGESTYEAEIKLMLQKISVPCQ